MYLSSIFSIMQKVLFLVLHVSGKGSFPSPLSCSEEKEYLQKFSRGDKNAREKLIEHNLRLVAHIVKKYYSSGVDQDDLVSIGTIGLIKAVDNFKLEKGIRLSSYAARCIENEVLMYFRNLKKSSRDLSLNEPIDTDKDGTTLVLMDIMCEEDSIIDDLAVKIDIEKLKGYVDEVLPDRENKVVKLRYGLNGKLPMTQREVAKQMGISRSYVSRMEKKALKALKKRFQSVNFKN